MEFIYQILGAGLWTLIAILAVKVVLIIDGRLNPKYILWEEIRKGNVAVGLASAGRAIGLGIIACSAILHNATTYSCAVWIIVGGLLQIAGIALFDLLVPQVHFPTELAKDNRAVGVVSFGMAVGLSLIVYSCII